MFEENEKLSLREFWWRTPACIAWNFVLCFYTSKTSHISILSLKISHTNIHRSKYHTEASMTQCFGLKCNNSLRRLPNGIFTNFHAKINRIFDQCLRQKNIDVSFWVCVYELCYFDAKWCKTLVAKSLSNDFVEQWFQNSRQILIIFGRKSWFSCLFETLIKIVNV